MYAPPSPEIQQINHLMLQVNGLLEEKRALLTKIRDLEAQVAGLTKGQSRVAPRMAHAVFCTQPLDHTCDACGKRVLALDDWLRCHECADYDLCRACFAKETTRHANGTHTFTDMGAMPAVVQKAEQRVELLKQTACKQHCDVCHKGLFPYQGGWFRCNECEDYNICGTCWPMWHPRHMSGVHTFTDMSTALRTGCGFPAIVTHPLWFNRRPYEKCICNGCGKQSTPICFFHCNECPQPGYDLCQACMVSTDLWRSHSSPQGPQHTFTNARYLFR